MDHDLSSVFCFGQTFTKEQLSQPSVIVKLAAVGIKAGGGKGMKWRAEETLLCSPISLITNFPRGAL